MMKKCVICDKGSNYKCPKCFVHYCSVSCNEQHRNNGCVAEKKQLPSVESDNEKELNVCFFDSISKNKLEMLRCSNKLKQLLRNPHLRNLLKTVESSSDAEKIMQKMMLEPIFVEFADACLEIVEPCHD